MPLLAESDTKDCHFSHYLYKWSRCVSSSSAATVSIMYDEMHAFLYIESAFMFQWSKGYRHRYWNSKTLARYILSSVCNRKLSQFSQLYFKQYMGLYSAYPFLMCPLVVVNQVMNTLPSSIFLRIPNFIWLEICRCRPVLLTSKLTDLSATSLCVPCFITKSYSIWWCFSRVNISWQCYRKTAVTTAKIFWQW